MEKIKTMKHSELRNIGFALLFPGIFLAMIFDGNKFVEVVGILLLLLSSAAFGASIKARNTSK